MSAARLNQELQAEGFAEVLVNDAGFKVSVVGKSLKWLLIQIVTNFNICQVAVGQDGSDRRKVLNEGLRPPYSYQR